MTTGKPIASIYITPPRHGYHNQLQVQINYSDNTRKSEYFDDENEALLYVQEALLEACERDTQSIREAIAKSASTMGKLAEELVTRTDMKERLMEEVTAREPIQREPDAHA